jgi:hypothetical protein
MTDIVEKTSNAPKTNPKGMADVVEKKSGSQVAPDFRSHNI